MKVCVASVTVGIVVVVDCVYVANIDVICVMVMEVVAIVVEVKCGAGNGAHNLHSLGSISFVHRPELVAAAAHSIRPNRLKFHPDPKTLLKTTVGTAFPLRLVNVAVAIGDAGVQFLVLHRPLEEALAAFASEQSIVIAAVFFHLVWMLNNDHHHHIRRIVGKLVSKVSGSLGREG